MRMFCVVLLLMLGSCASRTVPREYVSPVRPCPPARPIVVQHPPIHHHHVPHPNKEMVIVIDPGHGGEDFGTHSLTKPRYQEKYLNLSTAKLLKAYLEQLGYSVMMTRKEDVFIPLDKRAELANQLNPKLFVSVHYNSAPSKEAEGIEVFYFKDEENKERTAESKRLAQTILTKLTAETQAKSRGVKHGNFAVIRKTTMPAVLIEGGFLTNDAEMEKIKDPCYLKQVAWGIAQGIQCYLKR